LDKHEKYYDTIRVILSDSLTSKDIAFEYMVVCDSDKLRSFDINFLVLFGIAIGIIIIAIKTPPLLVFRDMTEEE